MTTWTLYKEIPNLYVTLPNYFSEQECDYITNYGLSKTLNVAGAGMDEQPQTDIRKSNVVFIEPNSETDMIYTKLTDAVFLANDNLFGYDLFSFGENLQFTEYVAPDGKYDSHIDIFPNGLIRKLTIVVQLTNPEDYDGGDLELLCSVENPTPTKRDRGTVIVFPSWLMHRVMPVTRGKRHSLVGWINGNPFK